MTRVTTNAVSRPPPCLLDNGIHASVKAPSVVTASVTQGRMMGSPTKIHLSLPVVAPNYYKGDVKLTVNGKSVTVKLHPTNAKGLATELKKQLEALKGPDGKAMFTVKVRDTSGVGRVGGTSADLGIAPAR